MAEMDPLNRELRALIGELTVQAIALRLELAKTQEELAKLKQDRPKPE
jgi:hypothetical protein